MNRVWVCVCVCGCVWTCYRLTYVWCVTVRHRRSNSDRTFCCNVTLSSSATTVLCVCVCVLTRLPHGHWSKLNPYDACVIPECLFMLVCVVAHLDIWQVGDCRSCRAVTLLSPKARQSLFTFMHVKLCSVNSVGFETHRQYISSGDNCLLQH